MNQKDIQRFISKRGEANENGCRRWKAGHNSGGYGYFWLASKNVGAHIVAWELANNRKVPKGLEVCHTCDVRDCIEPKHLFLGTTADNAHDRDVKGRTVLVRGEQHGMSVGTEDDIRTIRQLWDSGEYTQTQLGRLFGYSRGHISGIVTKKYWVHI